LHADARIVVSIAGDTVAAGSRGISLNAVGRAFAKYAGAPCGNGLAHNAGTSGGDRVTIHTGVGAGGLRVLRFRGCAEAGAYNASAVGALAFYTGTVGAVAMHAVIVGARAIYAYTVGAAAVYAFASNAEAFHTSTGAAEDAALAPDAGTVVVAVAEHACAFVTLAVHALCEAPVVGYSLHAGTIVDGIAT